MYIYIIKKVVEDFIGKICVNPLAVEFIYLATFAECTGSIDWLVDPAVKVLDFMEKKENDAITKFLPFHVYLVVVIYCRGVFC